MQYLLGDAGGEVKPQITAVFWGTPSKCYSLDAIGELFENGVSLLEYQLLEFDEALEAWKEYYEMSSEQFDLLVSVYNRKVANPRSPIFLTKAEVKQIGDAGQGGLSEGKISFNEMGIGWE